MHADRTRSPIPAKTALLSATENFCSRLAEEVQSRTGADPFIRQLIETLESDRLIRIAGHISEAETDPESHDQNTVADFRDLLLIGPVDNLQKRHPCRR